MNTLIPDGTASGIQLRMPKKVAEIRLCNALVFTIDDTADFVMPTEEQRKNLKETFCIEVIPIEERT